MAGIDPLVPGFSPWYVACSKLLSRGAICLSPSGTVAIVEDGLVAMKWRVAWVSLAVLLSAAAPLLADGREAAKAEAQFGIDVAQRGLWREAIYRWERAVELDPTYAAAFNNLAVAYEHEGQLDRARQAYEKALSLEPANVQIRQNFDLFKEVNERAASEKSKEQP